MIIPCDYLNLSLADEHVGDVTIPTQVIEYNQNIVESSVKHITLIASLPEFLYSFYFII
jgi:hypothetical protein